MIQLCLGSSTHELSCRVPCWHWTENVVHLSAMARPGGSPGKLPKAWEASTTFLSSNSWRFNHAVQMLTESWKCLWKPNLAAMLWLGQQRTLQTAKSNVNGVLRSLGKAGGRLDGQAGLVVKTRPEQNWRSGEAEMKPKTGEKTPRFRIVSPDIWKLEMWTKANRIDAHEERTVHPQCTGWNSTWYPSKRLAYVAYDLMFIAAIITIRGSNRFLLSCPSASKRPCRAKHNSAATAEARKGTEDGLTRKIWKKDSVCNNVPRFKTFELLT